MKQMIVPRYAIYAELDEDSEAFLKAEEELDK